MCLKLQKVTLEIKYMEMKAIYPIGQCFICWKIESKLILVNQGIKDILSEVLEDFKVLKRSAI